MSGSWHDISTKLNSAIIIFMVVIILNKALPSSSLHQWNLENELVDWVDEPFVRFWCSIQVQSKQ